MRLYAPACEVEHRPYLYLRLCDAKGTLHMPKIVVCLINIAHGYVRVRKVFFQSVPSRILCRLVVVDGDLYLAVHLQELVEPERFFFFFMNIQKIFAYPKIRVCKDTTNSISNCYKIDVFRVTKSGDFVLQVVTYSRFAIVV